MGLDDRGRPIPDPEKEPSRDGVLVAPNEAGGTNYRSPSFDPDTGLLLVSAQDGYGIYFYKPDHGDYGWAGADYNISGRSFLRAIDYRTGEIAWSHPIGENAGTAGVLTTASGLAVTGDIPGNTMIVETRTGETLWHRRTGRVGNGPITYMMDGRQFIVVGARNGLIAYALDDE
jgi:alcohol dehydrogenase (cytochrome c)